MLNKIIFCFVIMMSSIALVYCQNQKSTEHLRQLWFGYFNQTRLSDKWGTWLDLHLRTKEDFTNDLSQSIVRAGLTYYFKDAAKLTVGYAYVNHFPADNHKEISQPEHRTWQQIQWHTKYGKQRMMQWIRLEEKFRHKILNDSTLADGYSFNYKIRYNVSYEVPLSKKGIVPNALSFIANDELHINFGKQIIYNYFDQNRFFMGLKYQVNAHDNLQFGYMNLFQQLTAGSRYKNINTIRIFYFHNPDMRRKK
ncbi:MAG: DUF2490 domain-containing protein [Ginsengibacter sp.]